MKFSIVTPTKNACDNISATIESVISQKTVKFEHIIVDSISTDDTEKIVNQYSETYPIIFSSSKDEGISEAFNKGIKLSSGDWIIFLGAGDLFTHENVLSDFSNILKNKMSYLIVWGNIFLIDNKGKKIRQINGSINKFKLKRYMCIPHQATFHNKKVFEKYGLFSNDIKIAMDYDLILRFLDELDFEGYCDYDISCMLEGGVSQKNEALAVKDFREAQLRNKVWPKFLSNIIYYWAISKIKLKKIVFYNGKNSY